MFKVVIIGGGLSGLTAALRLQTMAEVVVLEKGARWGGQIHTTYEDGFIIERGGEGFVARSQALPSLAQSLGMPDALIGQSVFRSYGFDGQGLTLLEPGQAATFLGFQVPADDLGKGIRSLRRGMGSLVDALLTHLQGRAELRPNLSAVEVLAQAQGARVSTAHGTLDADAVIVATSAASASALLASLVGEPARALASASTLSSVTVELAYERAAIPHALDATGFVVALAAQHAGLRACTFTTAKFGGRAPTGKVSVRLFFRPTAEELQSLDDTAWTERAVNGLRRVLQVDAAPLRSWVSRWPDALPVFSDTHRSAVTSLETALAPWPIVLAGSAFHGSGIEVAVSSGERAAAAVLARMA